MALVCDGEARARAGGRVPARAAHEGRGGRRARRLRRRARGAHATSAARAPPPARSTSTATATATKGARRCCRRRRARWRRSACRCCLRLQRELPTARHGLVDALAALGLDVARPLDAARAARARSASVRRGGARSAALRSRRSIGWSALRPLFGVRTVAQTLMKLLDPLGCARARRRRLPRAVSARRRRRRWRRSAARGLCVQALGGLPEAAPGKIVRVCRAGGEPQTIDLRALAAFADAPAQPTRTPPRRRRRPRSTAPRSPAADAAAMRTRPPPPPRTAPPRRARRRLRSPPPPTPRRVLASGAARAVAARLVDA